MWAGYAGALIAPRPVEAGPCGFSYQSGDDALADQPATYLNGRRAAIVQRTEVVNWLYLFSADALFKHRFDLGRHRIHVQKAVNAGEQTFRVVIADQR